MWEPNLTLEIEVDTPGTVHVTRITLVTKAPTPVPTPKHSPPKPKQSTPVQSAAVSLAIGLLGITPLPALADGRARSERLKGFSGLSGTFN